MPAIFGLGPVTYWQAFGIVILAKLLFGGFGPHRHNHPDHFHKKVDDRWHRFIGVDRPLDRNRKSAPSRWHLYERFWKEEGSAAFDAFVEKMSSDPDEEDRTSDPEPHE
jgi:hypothetical protein